MPFQLYEPNLSSVPCSSGTLPYTPPEAYLLWHVSERTGRQRAVAILEDCELQMVILATGRDVRENSPEQLERH